MNNIYLNIFGSVPFLNILDELQFNKILNTHNTPDFNDKRISVKILFAQNLKIKELKNYLILNEPIILFLNDKNYIKKNSLHLLNFHIILELPIQILSFKEILNILVTKYYFFKQSKIIIKDYQIDSNERSITKYKLKVKLTEKELDLILALNKSNGLNKSFLLKTIWKHSLDLDTHAFETHLHRLRKKIQKYFKDKNFIFEKNSLYYLNN
jgi:hypothetical protein